MRLLEYLSRQGKSSLLVLTLALIALIGGLDYITGPELAFSIFYLIPISLVAWFVGRWDGILMSIVGALAWLIADLLAGSVYSHPTIPYWNATVRLGFFLVVTYVLSALRTSEERQEDLAQFIVHDLRSPLSNVMMGLQTLQEIGSETLGSTEKSIIETCLVSCNRMSTLISSCNGSP